MKKECQRIRQALPKYLDGHVFAINRTRIARHLSQCLVCRSEYEGLRRAEETRQILKDINAPGGVIGRMKVSFSTLGNLKKVFYRPLWITGIMLIAGVAYYYTVTPRQLDLEIERIAKTAPSTTTADGNPTLSDSAIVAPQHAAALPVAAQEPLIVTLIPENNASAVRKINEIMHGHPKLRKMKFSETIREVSASLTARELAVLFNRIESTAKISYNQQQFNSFPVAAPIHFVLKLKVAQKPVEEHIPPQRTEQAAPSTPALHPAEQPAAPTAETAPSLPVDH